MGLAEATLPTVHVGFLRISFRALTRFSQPYQLGQCSPLGDTSLVMFS